MKNPKVFVCVRNKGKVSEEDQKEIDKIIKGAMDRAKKKKRMTGSLN